LIFLADQESCWCLPY